MRPETKCARSGDVHIAYQVVGDGPLDLVLVPGGDKFAGVAVHIGARVAATAEPGEALVTSTVKNLVAGSGLRFTDRGAHALKGVAGSWHLFAVQT